MTSTPVADRIRQKLTAAFAPSRLELQDESARHAGHAGHHPAGESHFRLVIAAAAFGGKPRLERQRMVHAVLREELAARVHALILVIVDENIIDN